MTTALMPHDAADIVVPYLSAKMPDCTVSTRVQTRERMVYVQQVGGSRSEHIMDSVLVVIQAYSKDALTASEDCREAFTHLLSIRDDETHGGHVRGVEGFGLPGRFDDPDSRDPRYQATVQMSLRPLPTGAPA